MADSIATDKLIHWNLLVGIFNIQPINWTGLQATHICSNYCNQDRTGQNFASQGLQGLKNKIFMHGLLSPPIVMWHAVIPSAQSGWNLRGEKHMEFCLAHINCTQQYKIFSKLKNCNHGKIIDGPKYPPPCSAVSEIDDNQAKITSNKEPQTQSCRCQGIKKCLCS